MQIDMTDDDGLQLYAQLHDVIYIPGLQHWLFSVTAFANHGHYTILHQNQIHLIFGIKEYPLWPFLWQTASC